MALWFDLINANFFIFLHTDRDWIIIALLLTQGLAYFFDSKRHPQKQWTRLKKVLNDALAKCKNIKETITEHSEFKFFTSACCYQEQNVETSHRSGYCAMDIMDDFLKKSKYLRNHSQIIKWSKEMERDMHIGELLTEHGRLQKVLARIINKEVVNEDEKFHCQQEREEQQLHRVKDILR